MSYIVTQPAHGYPAGTVLRDVTLEEARSWDCNRCGDCCDGSRPDVLKDEATGFPLYTWESPPTAGSERSQTADPARYADRFDGFPLLQPLVRGEDGIEPGHEFERDADGNPYTAFKCRALVDESHDCQGPTSCAIYERGTRPANCGDFPVFGPLVSEAIINIGWFVPPTAALPRCTWHGIRVTGPWRQEPLWQERYQQQVLGLEVPRFGLSPELANRAAQRLLERVRRP